MVVHEGDIVHTNTEAEWQAADKAMSALDGVVPYAVAVGNHDLGTNGAALFNRFFGPQRFARRDWYGGHRGSGNENSYSFFTAGGMKFLVLSLEFGPRDEVLAWAGDIVDSHRECRVIVLTHCYMNYDDTRVGEGDEYNPHDYDARDNDGEEMWDKFVRRHANIFLVLSGHVLGDGAGRLTSTGDAGNAVHQVCANYQDLPNGGDGWLRIMTFDPAANTIHVTTYSPVLKQWKDDGENRFDLPYRME